MTYRLVPLPGGDYDSPIHPSITHDLPFLIDADLARLAIRPRTQVLIEPIPELREIYEHDFYYV